VEEFISRQLYPLLTYVFFEPNSAVIPARYKRLFSGETRFFAENQFRGSDMLSVYYNILNVIGKRLQEQPAVRITLVGNLDEVGFGPTSEDNDTTLARRRAESIRQYLRDVWKIAPERIAVVGRTALPERGSNSRNVVSNAEENRRVEIVSDDWSMTRPVIVSDTIRESNMPAVKFFMQSTVEGGVAKWTLTAKQGARILKQYGALGAPDSSYTW